MNRWQRVERLRRLVPEVRLSDREPIDKPPVFKPESTVWTQTGDGELRCWHISADGSLHETPESVRWSLERAADRAAGRVADEAS